MKSKTILWLTILVLCVGSTVAARPAAYVSAATVNTARSNSTATSAPLDLNLRDFGAVGNGVTDDGPALQAALDALAQAGGGTLFVPAGRYAIVTPVQKDFTGLDADVTIFGVESLTPVPPPTASGQNLTRGLDLVSEFAPRTGPQAAAINITGLESFLIKDITFIGTNGIETDAAVTLAFTDVWDATIRHCEFYGVASIAGGNIVRSTRGHLNVEQTVFLGCATNSGLNASVVENIEWKGINVIDCVFVDYGQRAELYGKLSLAAPFSWVSVGNAAPPENNSPRREAVIRRVFFDEGALNGLSSVPYHFPPPSAPVDLIYVSEMFMNVSNLGTSGNYIYGPQALLIEKSHYGWSHNAGAAINLFSVGTAIVDRAECVDHANQIVADIFTSKLTIIDSVYTFLNSQATITKVITTTNPDDDPVQFVRKQFTTVLGHEPDAAAHFYWSNKLLQCGENATCVSQQRAALAAYLGTTPAPDFSISGTVTDDDGAVVPGVLVTLGGAQTVTTQTGADGKYALAQLPTSGVYTVAVSHPNYTFVTPQQTVTTPNGNRTVNFNAKIKRYAVNVRVNDVAGQGVPGVAVSLSGPHSFQGTTDASGSFTFSGVPMGSNYTLTPAKDGYGFVPASLETGVLQANKALTIWGGLRCTLSGRVTNHGSGLDDATITLTGSLSGTTTTDANGGYSFNVVAGGSYTLAASAAGYYFSPPSKAFNNLTASQLADFAGTQSAFEFSSASYSADEDARTVNVVIERQGNTSDEAEVTYLANNGTADQRSDVIPVIGKLVFAPGETSKSFTIFIVNDTHVEGNESLTLELSNLVGGAPGANSTATFTIVDNDTTETAQNPIDGARFFVRQHYRDFLNREADAEGLDFWSEQIAACGTNAACIEDRRMNVSAAFFLSIEFHETGFLVYRLYQAAFAQPPQHLDEFLLDTRTIGEGLVVNAPGWQDLLEDHKTALIEDFVTRARFAEDYPIELTPTAFVNQLNATAGGTLSQAEIAAAIAEFAGAPTSSNLTARARVLRRVAESQPFTQRQLNPAFVLMQYFGYLQRNPSDPPNTNLDGYNFWLNKLNGFGGDFRRADMVKSFLVSGEYRERFGRP
jgi:hypothetical protein